MKKKKVLVLTDHMPWGHRSIAKAIYNYLDKNSKNIEVEYAQVKAETLGGTPMYTFAYKFFPSLGKMMYKPGFRDGTKDLVRNLSRINNKRLIRVINKVKPDLIISAYFLHSYALQNLREDMGFDYKLWTIVADPWTINPVSFVDGADLTLVYDEIGIKSGVKLGVSRSKMVKTGWWVRPEMYDKRFKNEGEKMKIRKELGFNDDRPVIFVGGGSLGGLAVAKLLPLLLLTKKKVGIIFNCGKDKLSYNLVESYRKTMNKVFLENSVLIKNFGWIEDIGKVIAASDIVFGKAGPNFLFDVIAIGKPFVSITHIGGQEDGNVDLIRKKGLGWIKEGNGSLGKFLKAYLKDPKRFNNMYSKTIKKEADNNFGSLVKIAKLIEKEM